VGEGEGLNSRLSPFAVALQIKGQRGCFFLEACTPLTKRLEGLTSREIFFQRSNIYVCGENVLPHFKCRPGLGALSSEIGGDKKQYKMAQLVSISHPRSGSGNCAMGLSWRP
jgi:hypothetical protein